MKKINKIVNVTLILILIVVFLSADIAYSSDIFYLRAPMGQIPTRKTQDVVLALVFDKLSSKKDIGVFIAALDEMGRKGMFDSYEFTKKFIEFYRELESGLQDTIGETLGKKIIEGSKSLININVGDCWILGEYYMKNPVPYQVLNLIILASDPRATGGFIPSELNKEAINTLHKIHNSLSGEERFRLCAYLDGVASGITPWVGPLKEIGAPGGYPLVLSMRLKGAAQNTSIPEGRNNILYPDFSTDFSKNPNSTPEPEEITAEAIRILKEKLGNSPHFTELLETIQQNKVKFIKGKPDLKAGDLPVDESIVSGPIVMSIAYSTDSHGVVVGVDSATAYVVDVLNADFYSKLVHELEELKFINRVIKERQIEYNELQELANLWYTDLITWLSMCGKVDDYKFNTNEAFESALQAAIHVFGLLMIKENHPTINRIFNILGDSKLAEEFKTYLGIFRGLAIKKEVQDKYGELLEKIVKGNLSNFSTNDKEAVLLWMTEFFKRTDLENARQSFQRLAIGL
ncbi:MAG: hypothetical protein ABIA97_04525 [Candidatus Omnitrophota bacterium]